MAKNKKRINIMSSCDENYAKYVPIQLYSISDSLNAKEETDVHFWLFHSRVKEETIEHLRAYSDAIEINFHDVCIAETEPYAQVTSKGGGWCHEAYFSLKSHRYLPTEVKRILYIDAADVLITGNIDGYYFADFDGCSLLVTCSRFKSGPDGSLLIHESADLGDDELRPGILRGLFNSGSYMINVEKMRRENMSINDFIYLKNELSKIYPDKNDIYFGDQGLIAAAFVGDIKYFGYPGIKNIWYMPYNFCMWFFDRSTEICGGNPWYIPRILHYCGNIKPWLLTRENEKELKPGQYPFYRIYQLYEKLSRGVSYQKKCVEL